MVPNKSEFDKDYDRVVAYYANYQPSTFEKRIVKRELQEDDTEDVTLECGHTSNYIIPTHSAMTYGFCSQCVEDYRQSRAEGH